MSPVALLNKAFFNVTLEALLGVTRAARERCATESLGFDIKDRDLLRAKLDAREHLEWWGVRFSLPRQSGATYWVSSLINSKTMVFVDEEFVDMAVSSACGELHDVGGGSNRLLPATTSYSRELLRDQVLSWSTILAMLGPPEDAKEIPNIEALTESLQRVEMVIIFGQNMDQQHRQIVSRWSRLYGRVPELVFIN